jgi:hypothetical protein
MTEFFVWPDEGERLVRQLFGYLGFRTRALW